jgi:hypothetical protein
MRFASRRASRSEYPRAIADGYRAVGTIQDKDDFTIRTENMNMWRSVIVRVNEHDQPVDPGNDGHGDHYIPEPLGFL